MMKKTEVKKCIVIEDKKVVACQEPILQSECFHWSFTLAIFANDIFTKFKSRSLLDFTNLSMEYY